MMCPWNCFHYLLNPINKRDLTFVSLVVILAYSKMEYLFITNIHVKKTGVIHLLLQQLPDNGVCSDVFTVCDDVAVSVVVDVVGEVGDGASVVLLFIDLTGFFLDDVGEYRAGLGPDSLLIRIFNPCLAKL